MLRTWLLLGALFGGLLPVAALGAPLAGEGVAAPGSWQGQAPALSVARSDRRSCSAPFTAPPLARGRQLAGVAWQFRQAPAAPLRAWLCQGAQCVALPGPRGRSHALAGLDAGQPLQLCFLREQPGPALAVSGLQLLVEYR